MRNWIIRTTQNQILGPVSKEKIIELIQQGKLEDEDEVASGNGYWFYIKEEDLVEKYILGDIPQGFNPVSEAEPVLSRKEKRDCTSTLGARSIGSSLKAPESTNSKNNKLNIDGKSLLPENDDLEYPSLGEEESSTALNADEVERDDMTTVGKMSNQNKSNPTQRVDQTQTEYEISIQEEAPSQSRSRPGLTPKDDDLEYPEVGIEATNLSLKQESLSADSNSSKRKSQPKVKKEKNIAADELGLFQDDSSADYLIENEFGSLKESLSKKTKKSEANSKTSVADITKKIKRPQSSRRGLDTYLMLLFGSLLVIIFAVIVYYKKIIKKPLPFFGKANISFISTANAQDTVVSKKKAF